MRIFRLKKEGDKMTEDDSALKNADRYRGYNLKRIAEAMEKIAKNTQQLNWNLGDAIAMAKEFDPILWERVQEKRKKEKDKKTK